MAAKTTRKSKLSKSDFIRQQPSSMSASEVVAKARANQISLTPTLVYKVRGRGSARESAAKKEATLTTPTNTAQRSKAEFVRAHPNLPAKELVAKARAAGIKLDVGYAYSLRSHDKKSAGKTAKRVTRRAQARNGGSVRRPVANGSAAENLLRAVAAEIGLGRAVEILEAERARVRAAIGG